MDNPEERKKIKIFSAMNKKRSFEIRVRNRAGEVSIMHMEAESTKELYEQIAKRHLLALEVKENLLSRFFMPVKKSRVKNKNIRDLFFQMGTFLNAGIPLEKLLLIILKQKKDKNLHTVLDEVYSGIRSGKRLSSLFAHYPEIFPGYVTASLKAGEESGGMADSLLEISKLIEKEIKLKDSLISSLTYPAILLFTAFASIFLIIYFAVPRFAQIFSDMGKEMPFILNIMFFASTHFWLTLIFILVFVSVIAGSLLIVWRNEKSREKFESAIINAPRIGQLLVNFQLSLYFHILGMAMKSSLPVDKGIELANSTLFSRPLKDIFTAALTNIRKGGRLSDTLENVSWMPENITALIGVAEESGQMDEMSIRASLILGQDLDKSLKILIDLAEPVMILFVSIIIGGVIITLLYSLFSINF